MYSRCIFEVYILLLGLQSGDMFIALGCLNRLALALRFAVAFWVLLEILTLPLTEFNSSSCSIKNKWMSLLVNSLFYQSSSVYVQGFCYRFKGFVCWCVLIYTMKWTLYLSDHVLSPLPPVCWKKGTGPWVLLLVCDNVADDTVVQITQQASSLWLFFVFCWHSLSMLSVGWPSSFQPVEPALDAKVPSIDSTPWSLFHHSHTPPSRGSLHSHTPLPLPLVALPPSPALLPTVFTFSFILHAEIEP